MKTICCRSFAALALLALTLVFHTSQAAAAESCADRTLCQDTSTFSATVTDFRTSVVGSNRQLIAVVNFQNKTDRPLIIGYVEGSGVALDERGNRYKLSGSNALRGIGEIRRNTFDPRFTLQPGERADARFELEFYAKNVVVGVQFQLDMAVREIDPVGGDQYRLGREHVLQFSGLRDGLNAAATSAAGGAVASAAPSAPASASAPVPETPVDPCAGRPRCHAAGPFTTEVVQLASGQKQGNNHSVRLTVRLRNLTNQPIVLSYQQNSGTMLDNYGQRYTVDSRSDSNVAGIGVTTKQKADPRFVLSPGEARDATFNYTRYVGKTAVGTVFSPDFVIEQLEILPAQQIRSVREYAIHFADVGVGASPAQAVNDLDEAARKLGEGLRSLFKKK